MRISEDAEFGIIQQHDGYETAFAVRKGKREFVFKGKVKDLKRFFKEREEESVVSAR